MTHIRQIKVLDWLRCRSAHCVGWSWVKGGGGVGGCVWWHVALDHSHPPGRGSTPRPSFCVQSPSTFVLRGWNPGRQTPPNPLQLWHAQILWTVLSVPSCRLAVLSSSIWNWCLQLFPATWNHRSGIGAWDVINWVNYKHKQNLAPLSLTYLFISSTRGFKVWIVCVNRPSISLPFLYGDKSNYGQHYRCPQSPFGFKIMNIS